MLDIHLDSDGAFIGTDMPLQIAHRRHLEHTDQSRCCDNIDALVAIPRGGLLRLNGLWFRGNCLQP